jgi:hypothetical protein
MTVLTSVTLHGITIVGGTRRCGEWSACGQVTNPEMAKAAESSEPESRRQLLSGEGARLEESG